MVNRDVTRYDVYSFEKHERRILYAAIILATILLFINIMVLANWVHRAHVCEEVVNKTWAMAHAEVNEAWAMFNAMVEKHKATAALLTKCNEKPSNQLIFGTAPRPVLGTPDIIYEGKGSVHVPTWEPTPEPVSTTVTGTGTTYTTPWYPGMDNPKKCVVTGTGTEWAPKSDTEFHASIFGSLSALAACLVEILVLPWNMMLAVMHYIMRLLRP
jgi:hypothetical protein